MAKIFLLALALFAISVSAVLAERRVALVVGNDRYSSVPALAKAINDAKAVSQTLRDMKFDEVVEAIDTDRRTLDSKVREFARIIKAGDTAFFFYAGHGLAVGSKNYLLPVDFPKITQNDDETLVIDEARSVDSILQTIQAKSPGRVFMILDACRDNPLPKAANRSLGRSAGLAIETPVTGVFMLFSAGFGQSALDGLGDDDPNPNSVFTRSLLPLLQKKGMSQVDIAKVLQIEVNDLAKTVKETQNPAYYDQIAGLYYLNGQEKEKEVVIKNPDAPVEIQGDSILAEWNAVKDMTEKAVFEGFLAKHSDDPLFSALAKRKIEELANVKADVLPEQSTYVEDAETLVTTQLSSPVVLRAEPQEAGDDQIKTDIEVSTLVTIPTDIGVSAVADEPVSAFEVQKELKRLACYSGGIDGKWGRSSKASLSSFNKYAKANLKEDVLNKRLLAVLQTTSNPACPTHCETGKTLKNGDCVAQVIRKTMREKTTSGCFTLDGQKFCE